MTDRLSRAKHCHNCEFYTRFTKQCKKCGCLVALKISFSESSCPINKWNAVRNITQEDIVKNQIG
jgi:hypothetical protein